MPEYAFFLVLFLLTGLLLDLKYAVVLKVLKKELALSLLIITVIGICLDSFAITRGYWSFGENYLLGFKVGVLPIEEIGFMLIMPYFFLVIYKLVERHFSNKTSPY